MATPVPPPSAEELEAVLSHLLVNNNDTIKAAEERLKEITKLPASTGALLERAGSSQFPEIRQLAAVLARKKCIRHWGLVGAEEQERIKTMLLHMLANETVGLVSRSIADVLSAIAKVALPAGQWNNLLQYLFECSQSARVEHREVALVVFMSLTDTIGDQLRPHFQQLVQIFLTGMSDASPQVRVVAVKAVSTLMQWLQTPQEHALGGQLLNPVLEVIQKCLAAGDDDTATQAIEMLVSSVEACFPVLETNLPTVVKYMLDIATSVGKVELNVREHAMIFVTECCAMKAKTLKKRHLVPTILQAIFTLCSEEEEEEEEEEDEDFHAFKFATACLDMLANNLPSKILVPSILHHCSTAVASPSKWHRRGAMYLLGTVAEGCHESLCQHLEQVLPWLLASMQDQQQVVKEAAFFALIQFAEFLQPEIVEHYEQMVPGILQALQEADPKVQEGACHALEAFCENLSEELTPYLETLMLHMGNFLQSPSLDMRSRAMSAIASAAGACGPAFKPYYHATMQAIGVAMSSTDPEAFTLRSRATELGGILAVVGERQLFDADYEGFVAQALEGLKLDSNEIREYTYGAFANIAELYKDARPDLVEKVLPLLLESIDSKDGDGVHMTQHADEAANGLPVVVGHDSDDDGEEDDEFFTVRTAWLDEKSSAVHCVGVFAGGMGAAFAPYLERSLASIAALSNYFHEDVRQNVQTTLHKLFAVSFHAYTAPMRATAGEAAEQVLHPSTAALLDSMMDELVRTMQSDDDKETVAQACEAVQAICLLVGPFCLNKFLQRLVETVTLLFSEKAPCQNAEDEDEDDEDDHDHILIDAVSELLGVMAKTWGPAFAPHFQALFPLINKFIKPSRQASDRLMGIGCIAECASHLREAATPYIIPMLPVLAQGLKDENSGVRRNAAFCCGVFCLAAPATMAPYVPQVLVGLEPLFGEDEEEETKDNAIGALARILQADPTIAQLPQLLPVICENLPLQGDEAENDAATMAILAVFATNPAALNPFLGKIVEGFTAVLSADNVTQNLKPPAIQGAVQLISTLRREYPEPMAQVIAMLPPDQQTWLTTNVPA